MTYFPHIDGLRAVAVLSVICFHLGLSGFAGGFVGVDVFFVISGFLITGIIHKEVHATKQFKFGQFYLRRARRLLPALLATLFLTTLIVVPFYSSEQLQGYGRELIAGLFSVSNVLFWTQSGYFDTAAESKTLLHMWSLSVEEQFYLAWPLLLLVALRRLSLRLLACVFVAVFAVSLGSAVWLEHYEIGWFRNQAAALFYLTPFRVYEFMIGAGGVWLFDRVSQNRVGHEIMSLLGMSGIVWSVVYYDASTPFPYYTALLPCVGTLLVILSRQSTLTQLLLANRFAVAIGLISYTLYLVHWPVIVLLKHRYFGELSDMGTLLAAGVTVVFSVAIYFGVEKPLRKPKSSNVLSATAVANPNKRFLLGVLSSVVIGASVGGFFILSHGLSNYKSELYPSSITDEGKQNRYRLTRVACSFAPANIDRCDFEKPLQVLVFGNSHEPDGYNIVHSMIERSSTANVIMFGGTNFCALQVDETGRVWSNVKRNKCGQRAAQLSPDLIRKLDIVVFSSNRPFAANKQAEWKVLEAVQALNPSVEIMVLGTYYNSRLECTELANRFGSVDACKSPTFSTYNGRGELAVGRSSGITGNVDFIYLDKFHAACAPEEKFADQSCVVEANGEPMYYDQHHLSLGFAKFLGNRFSEIYRNELESIGLLPNNNLVVPGRD